MVTVKCARKTLGTALKGSRVRIPSPMVSFRGIHVSSYALLALGNFKNAGWNVLFCRTASRVVINWWTKYAIFLNPQNPIPLPHNVASHHIPPLVSSIATGMSYSYDKYLFPLINSQRSFRSVVVITLASHARGPGFETQRKQSFILKNIYTCICGIAISCNRYH